ncbi:MAG: envelope stress response membrane protein PspB [Gammaproteobacteria bacterium]|nr:MAG: envelope stress response membrane protein PspB [Gammaproteobacteria bacterium]
MSVLEFMFVPSILFMVVVAPIWIVLHYRSVNRSSRSLSAEDRDSIEHMLETVDKLTARISTLESILDEYHAHWRDSAVHRESQSTEQGDRL